jgi:ankyrin repeat protein
MVLTLKPIPDGPYDLSNIPQNDHVPELSNISSRGDIEEIKHALKLAIDINEPVDSSGNTMLINTILYGYKNKLETVKFLLENGADVSRKNERGLSALSYVYNDSNILKLLINRGVTLNCPEGYEVFIASASYYKIVQLFIENGIFVDCVNKIGLTALMRTVYYKGKIELLNYLINKGADVNARHPVGGLTSLMIASRLNNTAHLKFLIEKGANVNLKTVKEINALDIAIEFDNAESIEILKKNGATSSQEIGIYKNIEPDNFNNKIISDPRNNGFLTAAFHDNTSNSEKLIKDIILNNNNGAARLHKAVIERDYETINTLATKYTMAYADCDYNMMTPIFYAVILNDFKATKWLLQVPAFNCIDSFGMSATRWAHHLGRHKIIELFQKYEITKKLNYRIIMQSSLCSTNIFLGKDFLNKSIPMIKEGNYEKIKKEFNYYFFDHEDSNYILSTALFAACYNGDTESAEFLINKGVAINSIKTGHEPVSVLMAACYNNQNKMAEFLIEKGADINYVDNYGYSIFHKIIINRQLELAELFIHKGLNVNKIYRNGKTLLMSTCEGIEPNSDYSSDYLKMVELLLKYGADPNIKSGGPTDQETALMMALEMNNNDIANTLIANGADVNAADAAGITPLMIAARRGNIEGVKILLNHNVKINACDEDGENALCGAIMTGHNKMVELLIDNKIKMDVINNRSQTLSQIAIKFKNYEATKLLDLSSTSK